MRILLDQAVHDHRNRGNNSLLEVALRRFTKFWPEASFDVISISPHFCKVYLENVQPVDPVNFYDLKSKFDRLYQYVPKPVWYLLFELREAIAKKTGLVLSTEQIRSIVKGAAKSKTEIISRADDGLQSMENESVEPYQNIGQYDLYVPTGGGYFCDSDKRFLMPLLDRIATAHAQGVITIMVGQGMGPIQDLEIIEKARKVLPKVDYLLIREEKLTRPLLDSLDMPSEKILMTGDDAIELAFVAREENLGNGIGISLRVTSYTDVNAQHLDTIRPVILNAARKYNAPLVAAPIDTNEDDRKYIADLARGYTRIEKSWKRFESTGEVIKRISRCRIMISGTFHGAVFAISQGIPVIALAKSTEYANKISGLATEFGEQGCQIIKLDDARLEENLASAIDFAWNSAEQLRPRLLKEAKRQIDLGYAAYQKVFSLVESKKYR
ncbi:MAG: polysaccharide pyruvyl transferase family protein [candidate division KSB1 bacterium]|nr:polysaccharide pyruvyl transferase family protein [candidate division KSB1 bacterium]